MIWTEVETNSLCPHSFSPMPNGKFHNFAMEIRPHDDDDYEDIVPCEQVKYTKSVRHIRHGRHVVHNRHVRHKTNSDGVKHIENDIEYDNKCDV